MSVFRQVVRPFQKNNLRIDHHISIPNFNDDYVFNHIQTSYMQKTILTIGASIVSLLDPSRGDMIATLGETSSLGALRHMKSLMEGSEEGLSILKDMPRINSRAVNLEYLKKLPVNTVGNTYYTFLEKNKVTPDSRLPVQFVDDFELAYIMQRYREIHDLIHTILAMPTNMLGEVTVKWVEGIQTRLPMCIGGGLFGAIRLAPKQRIKYVSENLPWAIKTGMTSKLLMNIYFEKRWEQEMTDLHNEFDITPLKEYMTKKAEK